MDAGPPHDDPANRATNDTDRKRSSHGSSAVQGT
jgi:hypothetical protein